MAAKVHRLVVITKNFIKKSTFSLFLYVKRIRKKDLGMIATTYGYVYVAQIAMGADHAQTLKAYWKNPMPELRLQFASAYALETIIGRVMKEAKSGRKCLVLALPPAWGMNQELGVTCLGGRHEPSLPFACRRRWRGRREMRRWLHRRRGRRCPGIRDALA